MAVPSDHDIILALGEDLPIGIWVARAPSGAEVYANRMFAEIMGTGAKKDVAVGGYSEPYGILTRDRKPYPEDRLPFVRALVEKQVVVVDDITIRRPDDTCVDIRAYGRPVTDAAGVITHVVIAFFDITREVAAEKARAESEQRLHRAQRLQAIGTLAGGIAHDFNNLIFGIKLIAADLAAGESDPERKEALHVIDEITERSATLTHSLLGFARRGKHRAVAVCLSDVVASMADLLRRTASGLELTIELAANNRGCVIGDQSQLEQVIMNLVGNARDALQGTGRVAIRTYDRQLSGPPSPGAIGAASAGAYVVLEVSDDGPGIPADLRERVFEPYFTTKVIGPDRGTGLGLATVSGIVEIHGGSTEIDLGLDGRGTTMRVYLPVAARRPEPAPPPAKKDPPKGSGTILIVDDDAIVRRALARSLSVVGYKTIEASSGPEAIETYRARHAEIGAVLLDMVMPGMSGRSTYLGLREIDSAVGVILMSGYTLNDQVQEILDLGVKSFVTKPHSPELLAQLLAEITSPAYGSK
ncbi:MAG: ATP-binding protein [Kofleriaceae bacterium]